MPETPQMRTPLKRWLALAVVVIASTTVLAWRLSRPHHSNKIEAASASVGQPSNSPANTRSERIDSDNDGIPDVIELRSFQDRDSFRRWFTAIAEMQFYQLSDQWKAEQR